MSENCTEKGGGGEKEYDDDDDDDDDNNNNNNKFFSGDLWLLQEWMYGLRHLKEISVLDMTRTVPYWIERCWTEVGDTHQQTALSSHLATPARSLAATGQLYSQAADHVQ